MSGICQCRTIFDSESYPIGTDTSNCALHRPASPAPEPPSATTADDLNALQGLAALLANRTEFDGARGDRYKLAISHAIDDLLKRDALAADAKRLREIAGTLIRTWQDGSLNSIAYDDLIDTCATRLAEMDRRAAAMPRAERGAEPMP